MQEKKLLVVDTSKLISRAGFSTKKVLAKETQVIDAKFSIVGGILLMWTTDEVYKIGDKYDLERLRDMADACLKKLGERL